MDSYEIAWKRLMVEIKQRNQWSLDRLEEVAKSCLMEGLEAGENRRSSSHAPKKEDGSLPG